MTQIIVALLSLYCITSVFAAPNRRIGDRFTRSNGEGNLQTRSNTNDDWQSSSFTNFRSNRGRQNGLGNRNQGSNDGFGSNRGFGNIDLDSFSSGDSNSNGWNRGAVSETAAHFNLGGDRKSSARGSSRIAGGTLSGAEIDSFAGVNEREGNVRSGAHARRTSFGSGYNNNQNGQTQSLGMENNGGAQGRIAENNGNNNNNNGWNIGSMGSSSSAFGSRNGGFDFQSSRIGFGNDNFGSRNQNQQNRQGDQQS